MKKIKIGKYEKILLSVGGLIFITLMSIVILKPELITGLIVDTSEAVVEEEKDKKEELERESKSEPVKLNMNVERDYLEFNVNFNKKTKVAGLELYLEKEGIDIKEVSCIGDFSCVKKDIEDSKNIRIFLMRSPEDAQKELQNQVRLVKINYEGSGTLSLKNESFISSIDQGTIQIESKKYEIKNN